MSEETFEVPGRYFRLPNNGPVVLVEGNEDGTRDVPKGFSRWPRGQVCVHLPNGAVMWDESAIPDDWTEIPARIVLDVEPDESTGSDYEGMTFRELQAECKERGLSASGSTEELVLRLEDNDAARVAEIAAAVIGSGEEE